MKDRSKDILNSVNETLANSAQKTYKGQKRSELKDSDFLFPETRSFPIVTPQDIPDAISNFGRMKGQMSYDAFLKKLYNMAKRKGPEFVSALPEASKEQLGIKKKITKAAKCAKNKAEDTCNCDTKTGNPRTGDPQVVDQIDTKMFAEESDELMEYKNEFLEMSIGSIKSILTHANNIINALENPSVKENLTESWLQGKIAVTEDYMITIHNFVMFGESETDTEASTEPEKKKKVPFAPLSTTPKPGPQVPPTIPAISGTDKKPGLWENIRKKRERMGKNYKPAKTGEKDRPDPEQWKKLTK